MCVKHTDTPKKKKIQTDPKEQHKPNAGQQSILWIYYCHLFPKSYNSLQAL